MEKNIQSFPLVTLGVITYNSSKFILDTLDSTLYQTYPNIELVISDDCSTDNTQELITKWIELHKHHFSSVLFVSTPKNIGVAGNCNNIFKNSTAKWIKLLSGDDKLVPECISEFVNYTTEHPEAKICGCKFKFVSDISESYLKKMSMYYRDTYYPFLKGSLKYQKKKIISGYYVPVAGPCIFFSREIWEMVGGFDEKYPFAEEEPFFFRVVYSNNKIFFVDKELYIYNFRSGSLGHDHGTSHFGRFQLNRMKYFFDERFKLKLKHGYIFDGINTYLTYKADIARRLGKHRSYRLITILRRCSPYMIWRYIEYTRGKKYDKIK